MRSQRVDQLDPLRDQLLADTEHHRARLLFGGLGFNELHNRPGGRLDNGLGVGCIVFLAIDVGRHIPQPPRAAETPSLPD